MSASESGQSGSRRSCARHATAVHVGIASGARTQPGCQGSGVLIPRARGPKGAQRPSASTKRPTPSSGWAAAGAACCRRHRPRGDHPCPTERRSPGEPLSVLFLADESCDDAVVQALRKTNHDVKAVREWRRGAPDRGRITGPPAALAPAGRARSPSAAPCPLGSRGRPRPR